MQTLLATIEKHWGFHALRPLQQDAMAAVLHARDSLTVLPTGGGKSLCYQAPALVLPGATVVVSPLISLMKDQVDSLRENGVAACSFDSSQSADDRQINRNDLLSGNAKLVFTSPERLMTGDFQSFLRQLDVRRFAIDEAHCVSHWGHDFRPEYRQMGQLKTLFPHASVHAFTATATEHVREDICRQLHLAAPLVLVGNFDRPNLTYRVLARRDMRSQVREVLERNKAIGGGGLGGGSNPGIIYCIRRKEVDALAESLQSEGYNVLPYHAGMTPIQRQRAQEKFADEKCDIIVATVAFGMGIDRSNVRFVLHTGMPKSIEHYQQEAGRAGRDGLEAECVLLYSAADTFTWKSIIEKSASEAAGEGAEIDPAYVPSALKHVQDMDSYARSPVCRHKALVEYFGQPYESPGVTPPGSPPTCSACDLCLGDTEMVEGATIIAQKILSAVYRTGQRFGANHIIAVLRGQNLDRIRQLGHEKLSVYGIMADTDERTLRDFIFQLVGQGVLAQQGDEYPIIVLNAASNDILKKKREARLVQPKRKDKPEKSRSALVSWEGVDKELFESLREFRINLAHERGVPPYIIFSDATLRELARVRPASMEKMRLVYGIGEKKLTEFGPRVLQLITDHCRAKKLSTNVSSPAPLLSPAPARPASSRLNPEREKAFKLFRSGASIDDVSRETGRARATISEYLADFIAETRPPNISAWVDPSAYQKILQSAQRVGSARLKPIYIDLNEQFDYDQIRLVVAHLQSP